MEKIILVTGASGFVGRAVVTALLREGYHVRALVHHETSTFEEHPCLTRIVGDIRDLHILESNMVGVFAVVHLAAAKNDEKESYDVNVRGASTLIDACHITNVQRIINISTQSTRLPKKGVYGSTKEQADRLLHAAPLAVTTLRSSLVYGEKESGIFGTIVRYCALPIIPMIGNGRVTFRPIHRDDVAAVIVHALTTPSTAGKIYEVGGKEVIDLQTITQKIMQAEQVHRPIVHLPIWLALAIAHLCKFLPHPPLTVSNVLGGAVDVAMDMTSFQRDFGSIPIRTLEEGMKEMWRAPIKNNEEEAVALLRYVLSAVVDWHPDAQAIALYIRAVTAHNLHTQLLPSGLFRSSWKLGAVDTASRLCFPESPLQKKLLIASAVAEVVPASAEILLPKERTILHILMLTINYGIRVFWKYITALPFFIARASLKRNAGII